MCMFRTDPKPEQSILCIDNPNKACICNLYKLATLVQTTLTLNKPSMLCLTNACVVRTIYALDNQIELCQLII
jgi:hypothetical protein